MENEYFSASDKIDFIPNVSTCFFGVTSCGKSHRMVEWAKELQSEGKPFLFILTKYHEPKQPDRAEHWMMEYKLSSLKPDVDVSKPILFITEEDTTLDDLINLTTVAMCSGVHIFLDESRFHNDLIEFMHCTNYLNFTASAQSFLDCPTVDSSNRISIEDFSNITRKFIGKQLSIEGMHTLLLGRIGYRLTDISRGTFFNHPVLAHKEYKMKIENHFIAIDPKIVVKCNTVLESRLYEQMATMSQSNKTEISLNIENYTSEGDIDEETGKIYEQKLDPTDITANLLNNAIKSIGTYGFILAEYFQVIEKNDGEFYLQYIKH